MKTDSASQDPLTAEESQIPGYPLYPDGEDIYCKEKKEPYTEVEVTVLDEGLDVPGSELDDASELIGEEDEENNYYSLGGDDHHDLEENRD